MNYRTKPYKVFQICNNICLGILSLLCLLPLINILAISLSAKHAADSGLVSLIPIGFNFEAYKLTLTNSNFINAFKISVLRTILGTAIQLILMVLAAFALSKNDREFKGRTFYSWFFVFTMLFNGGLIPWYLTVSKLGLIDSIWALVLPGAVPVFSLVLMLNFFRRIPKELSESAAMDGAGHLKTLFRIYLPLATPSIATLALFSMVYHWNSWFDGLVFINDFRNYPLATFLHTLVIKVDPTRMNIDPESMKAISGRTLKSAQLFVSMIPIIIVYPFLQKYFVKGITLGAVKE